MNPEVKKWVEKEEDGKIVYVIETVPVPEEEEYTYKDLFLRMYYYPIYPYANYVCDEFHIHWDGADTIEITKRVIRDSWGGTGSEVLGTITIKELLPESPWFFVPEELENNIKKYGVKQTIEDILEAFAEDATAFFAPPWKED